MKEIEKVTANIETICCDGGQDGLGHPAVYYSFDNLDKIVCGYCGKIYIKEKDDEHDIENLDLDNNEDNLEDDTVLLEDETEIDPAADAGIRTPDEGEEEY